MSQPPAINCPICNKENTWNLDNPARPFCSARCKLIDLGEWASETRTIPGENLPEMDQEDCQTGED